MNKLRSFHQRAVELRIEGDFAEAKGQLDKAIECYKKAFELEKEVAFSTSELDEDPIPHFVFLRGAAALANDAGYLQESEKLIEIAKSKNPPAWLLKEFEEIKELINRKRNASVPAESAVNIHGKLIQANAKESEITVEDSEHKSYSIFVPMEQIKNIIKSYWLDKVVVQGRRTANGLILLEKIKQAA